VKKLTGAGRAHKRSRSSRLLLGETDTRCVAPLPMFVTSTTKAAVPPAAFAYLQMHVHDGMRSATAIA
jgi:hypothetical protein